jgi:phosphoribosylanthranilate isomerase
MKGFIMVRVKICGNRSIEEVLMAVRAGADAIGLIVGTRHLTEDNLDANIASEILRDVPPFISPVLVTHFLFAEEIMDVYQKVTTPIIQLHDDIMPDEIKTIRTYLPCVRLIKSVHVVDKSAIETSKSLAPFVDAILLDSRTKDRIGGTGLVHDWSISSNIVSLIDKPVILAGGLNPRNIVQAIKHVRPFGVDVNSGVEFPDGRKNPQKINDFVRLSKKCVKELDTDSHFSTSNSQSGT